ncbi:phagocyte signaling-impaired protein [Sitophilus oryzae]|uniref:N-terminal acetyltransferase B complex subunit MDM20 homolog n=1 Tax=Sitophilus oryzae TaxID=7048 RepID=A0A6J2XUM3_SITOR|nr:phagocyte signaling-impaired protein [Sitophilus oryzae]
MSRHVQNTDPSVLERRLRPIYDWLDSGNNKKALQECEKVLKKTPNLHCAKALKALTLHRMGREQETNVILDNLASEVPTEEATLQAMALCYREMQQVEKISKLYETAVKLNPTNEELHTHLFMTYVRIGNFKAQQQSAMALYKQKPKNPYYCWIVMSIILQARRGEGANDEKKRKVLLNLAERMMEKLVNDNKMEAEQEVQLYIMVLEMQLEYEKILDLVDGPLGEKLQCSDLSILKLLYLKKLQRWQQVNSLCKIILSDNFDKWNVWKTYIASVFDLYETGVNGNGPSDVENDVDSFDNTPEKCHEFICGIIEDGAENSFLLRAPYLARFELCSKLQEKNIKTEDILGDKIELFIEYFRKFGHKSCCVFDLKIYLKVLDAEQKSELATKLIKEVGIGSTSVPQSADQMQSHIGALQLARLSGGHRNLSTEHLRALVTALTLHYQHGYQSYGKDLPSTDLGPSDNYAIMAAHILFDLSKKEDGSDSLISALALLESFLTNSPSNFHAKLLALKYYHILGAVMEANSLYYLLDIKHLQLDSLGYVHCGRLATTGLYSLCAIHFDTTLKFFSSNYKDSTDHLTFSYKFGSFMKLDEFMDFREKLNNSLHYTTTVVDRIVLSLVDCSTLDGIYNVDISFKENKIEWDKLRDNRDLSVYVNWEPEFAENVLEESDEIKTLFAQDLNFLKLRTHILWSLSAGLEVLRSVDGTRQQNIASMRQILKDWEDLENNVKKCDLTPISEDSVSYPLPSRLHAFLDTPFRPIVTLFLSFFEFLTLDNSDEIEKASKATQEELSRLTETLEKKLNTKSSDFREKRKGVERIVNTVEALCIACVMCLMCNELVKPPPQGKKAKKKNPIESKLKCHLDLIINEIKTQINKTSGLVNGLCGETDNRDLVTILDSLNLNTDCATIRKNILLSYRKTRNEIQDVLKSKLKCLDSL